MEQSDPLAFIATTAQVPIAVAIVRLGLPLLAFVILLYFGWRLVARRVARVHEEGPLELWVPRPKLASEELVKFEGSAGLLVGRRGVGGWVAVTDRRFLFIANRTESRLRNLSLDIPRSAIVGVRVSPRGQAAARTRGVVALKRPQVEIDLGQDTIVLAVPDSDPLVDALG